MNIDGHHHILLAGALEALRSGLEKQKINLTENDLDFRPMFVGNWLEDVTQVHGLTLKISRLVNEDSKSLIDSSLSRIEAFFETIGDTPEKFSQVLTGFIENIIYCLPDSNETKKQVRQLDVQSLLQEGITNTEKAIDDTLRYYADKIDKYLAKRIDQVKEDIQNYDVITDILRKAKVRTLESFEELTKSLEKAIEAVKDKLHELYQAIKQILENLLKELDWLILELGIVNGEVKDFAKKIRCKIEGFLNSIFPTDPKQFSRLGEFINSAIMIAGYYHFPKPITLSKEPSAEDLGNQDWLDQYKAIIEEKLFRKRTSSNQFERADPWHYFSYSYLHLDRPKGRKYGTESKKIAEQQLSDERCAQYVDQSDTVWASDPGTSDRKIYKYMEQDLDILASRLFQLEKNWALTYFYPENSTHSDPNKNLTKIPSNNDPEWSKGLVELGSILHTSEDFFAHSTFVELAMHHVISGKTDRLKDHPSLFCWSRIKWAERLQKLQLDKNRQQINELKNDELLSTGTYDTPDLLISLAEVLFDDFDLRVPLPLGFSIGLKHSDPGIELEDLMGYPERIRDMKSEDILDRCMDLAELLVFPGRALINFDEENDNEIVKKIHEMIGVPKTKTSWSFTITDQQEKDIQDLMTITLFKDFKQSKKFSIYLVKVIHFLAACLERFGLLFRWAYFFFKKFKLLAGTISKLKQTGTTPLTVLNIFIFDPLIEKIKDQISAQVSYALTDQLIKAYGGRAIGSHSLIAKDSPHSLFYREAERLAIFADWHIVRHLTRSDIPVEDEPEDRKNRNRDWRVLVDEIFRHPETSPNSYDFSIREKPVIGDLLITTNNDKKRSLKVLERQYRPKADARDALKNAGYDKKPFWWTIADRNYGTYGATEDERKRIINKILADSGSGYRVTRPNWAWNPGTKILVPFQQIGSTYEVEIQDERDSSIASVIWWLEVLSLSPNQFIDQLTIPKISGKKQDQLEMIAAYEFPAGALTKPPFISEEEANAFIDEVNVLIECRREHQLESDKPDEDDKNGAEANDPLKNPCYKSSSIYLQPDPVIA